jgi:PPOX class probable F420-dependent enzyme
MPTPPLPEHVQALLAKPNPAVMGTIRANGAPLTAATWYLWEDGRVLLNFDAGRKRLEHVRRDPRLSLTVLDGADWNRHVTLHGRAASIEDDRELADIDRLAMRYGYGSYSERRRPRVSVWVEIESWHGWGV